MIMIQKKQKIYIIEREKNITKKLDFKDNAYGLRKKKQPNIQRSIRSNARE